MLETPRQEFVLLYKNFALPLMKFIVKRMGGNQEAAEEVFSQTIYSAWKGFHTFEHKSQFFTWVCRIGLNKMADYYRSQIAHESRLIAPTLEDLANFPSRGISIEEKLALEDLRASIRQCLNALPQEQRKLLYLRYWKEETIKKIAEITGISERSVEGKLYRARLALKSILSKNTLPS